MDRERLLDAARSGRIMHALLIAGPAGSGRTALARQTAAAYLHLSDTHALLNCPDYCELTAPYAVDHLRDQVASLAMQAFSHGRRAFVLTDAHRMNANCQNALLKALEEPPADTLLVLAGSEAGLLPTIRSRCAIVRLGAGPIGEAAQHLEQEGVERERAASAAALADGVLGRARQLATEECAAFFEAAVRCFEAALFGGAPFSAAAALLKQPALPTGEKQKQEAVNAPLLLELWAGIARDALAGQVGGTADRVLAAKKLSERMAAAFTTAEIQGIIEMLGAGQRRLWFGASPAMTVDSLLAALKP